MFGVMPTKELRFAFDEKGIKSFAPSLVGQTMTYWEDDRHVSRGRVTAAEVKRDRYGNPYIEVEIEPLTQAATLSTSGEKPDAAEHSAST
jgi:hypothetical protein